MQISLDDFAHAFGVDISDLSLECIKAYNTVCSDLVYDIIEDQEKLRGEVSEKIDKDIQKIGSPERTLIWQRGWEENLESFKVKKSAEALRPKYYRPGSIMRWQGEYIQPHSDTFEVSYLYVFQEWLFSYFKPYNNIYEFGCGSCINLFKLASMYPTKNILGSDFVPASVELANELGKVDNNRITGFLFDMINPDYNIKIPPNSAVLTSGALEQLASKIEHFFNYLLIQKPELCIFAEPIIEIYDNENILDKLAIKFHRKRGYTEGIIPWLKQKEMEGKVKILKIQRQNIGSLFFEGWTIVIWKIL